MADPVLTVRRLDVLDEPLSGQLQSTYRRAFELLAPRSIVRAIPTEHEWAHFASCPHIVKYVAFADDRAVGLLLIAVRPDVVDWLEPATFAARWPAEDPWYFMGVAVEPDQHGSDAFRALLDTMFVEGGPSQTIVFDTCAYNTPHLPRAFKKRADLIFGAASRSVEQLEAQRFLAASVVDGTLEVREIDREQFGVLRP